MPVCITAQSLGTVRSFVELLSTILCYLFAIPTMSIQDGSNGDTADDHYHRYMVCLLVLQSTNNF